MVLIERIVRPHLPATPDPTQQKPQCQAAPTTQTVKMVAPSILAQTAAATFNPNLVTASGGVERTRNSSESYSYKKYMTKQEKEKPIPIGSGGDLGQFGTDPKSPFVGTDPLGPRPSSGAPDTGPKP